jgi:hypothetical protein
MTTLKLELNIALIPDKKCSKEQIALSVQLAKRYPALVRLGRADGRLAMAPHLTLYQVPHLIKDMPEADRRLAAIASATATFALEATGCAYNEGEASFEISYGNTSQLTELQERIIAALNPLRRQLLLERDPAGKDVKQLLRTSEGVLHDNLRITGYAETGDPAEGGLFRPHVTTNWFEPGTRIDLEGEPLVPLATLSGSFPSLGIYVLGPYGTCPQLLAAYALKPSGSLASSLLQ